MAVRLHRRVLVVKVVNVVAQHRKETDLARFLDLIEAADGVRRSPVQPLQATDPNTASQVADNSESPAPLTADTEARRLVAAGRKPKTRLGKTIWQRPDTGFWVSQEMALHLLDGTERSEQKRGKAGRVTQRGDAP
jgi:hypothetical protein